MNKNILDQLQRLQSLKYEIDGGAKVDFDDDFSEVVFFKKSQNEIDLDEKKFTFENYMIAPFPGFDFNKKFNNGIDPPEKVMYGKIIKETEKMYKVQLYSKNTGNQWCGWTPKKSVTISDK